MWLARITLPLALAFGEASGAGPIAGIWGAIFRIAGLRKTVAYLQEEAEANWIRTYQPEIWQNTHKYLLLSGYLTYRLVGQYVDSVGCQVGYIPFDYKRQRWSAGWDWKWRLLPSINVSMMPELKPPGKILGTITARAAKETGIPVAMLDPVATGPEDAPLSYYETVMRKNMKTLESTLGIK